MSKIIYIAGSISNNGTLDDAAVVERLALFAAAEIALGVHGYQPLNPARRGKVPGKTWLDYMRDSLRDIAECDGIALLDGWQDSRGAQVERELVLGLGLPVRPLHEWLDDKK